MNSLLTWLSEQINNLGNAIVAVLPLSPFRGFIDNFQVPEYVGWLNWFFPVREFLLVMAVWLTSIAAFYLYSIIMRWVKMIGD